MSLQTRRSSCATSFVGWNPYWCIAVGALERVLMHQSSPLLSVSPQCASLPGSPVWSIATFRVRALKPPPGLAPAQIQRLSPGTSLLQHTVSWHQTPCLASHDPLQQPQGPGWTLTVRCCGAVPARPKYLVSGQGKREKRVYNGIR